VAFFLWSPIGDIIAPRGSGFARACATDEFLRSYAAVPRELLTGQEVGVGRDGGCPNLGYPDIPPALTVLSAMFAHGGWAHLLGNMLFLFVFGNNVEDRIGRMRYLLFYLVAGYIAAYGFALTFPQSTAPLVGASGAVAAVLGSYLVLFPRLRVVSVIPPFFFLPFRLPAWMVLGLWFILQWAYFQGVGLSGVAGVAYAAHVYGFLFGVLFGFTVRRG
jgi:membrane associated rhomboid family serine protease